jgi:hypothetical protein
MSIYTEATLFYGIKLPDIKKVRPKANAGNWDQYIEEKGIRLPRGVELKRFGNPCEGFGTDALVVWEVIASDYPRSVKIDNEKLSLHDPRLLEACDAINLAKKYHKPQLHLALYMY